MTNTEINGTVRIILKANVPAKMVTINKDRMPVYPCMRMLFL